MHPIIRFDGVSLGYGSRVVLPRIDLEVREGDFLAILGPNGSGKTTILRAILGILKPLSGQVLAPESCGYSPQRRALDAIFPFTVEEVVAMGLTAELGPLRRPGRRERDRVRRALAACGVRHLAERAFRELSGGQQQRTLVARALVTEPEVLILDEPTNDLDLTGEHEIMELIATLNQEGRTVVMVSHLLNVVAHYATSVVVLHGGQLEAGEAAQVLTSERLSRLYGIDVVADRLGGRRAIVPRPVDPAARSSARGRAADTPEEHNRYYRHRSRLVRLPASLEKTIALGASAALRVLPRDVACELGAAASVAAAWFARDRWDQAAESLEKALPAARPGKRRRLRARSFRNAGRGLVETARVVWTSRRALGREVSVEGAQHLERARREGRGVIVLAARQNGGELLAATLARTASERVSWLEDRTETSRIAPVLRALRVLAGVETIPSKGGLREARVRLERAEIVLVPIDRSSTGKKAVFVPFLGHPAATSRRAAALALATGAPVVPAVVVRAPSGRYRIELSAPLTAMDRAASEEEAIQATTQAGALVLESAIRARPAEWRWDHDRWRRRPRVTS